MSFMGTSSILFNTVPFPLKTSVCFSTLPIDPVKKEHETCLSLLPFLRLRLVMIIAKHSLLAIERPVVALPFFAPFLHMFSLIITLIKTKECLNSIKRVAIVPHSYLSQYIAVYCLPLFIRREGFPIMTL